MDPQTDSISASSIVTFEAPMKTAIASALLILLTVQVFSQSLNLLEPSAKRKVDPLLQQSILSRERFPDQAVTTIEYHAAGTRATKQLGDMVGVLIESSADITQFVRSMGGTVGSKHGNIYKWLEKMQTSLKTNQEF